MITRSRPGGELGGVELRIECDHRDQGESCRTVDIVVGSVGTLGDVVKGFKASGWTQCAAPGLDCYGDTWCSAHRCRLDSAGAAPRWPAELTIVIDYE